MGTFSRGMSRAGNNTCIGKVQPGRWRRRGRRSKGNNTCIGKVQQQIRCFLRSLYQKPVHLSISSTILLGKVKNIRRKFAPHPGAQTRRKSGVPSVLRSKTLAQAEFISAEQVQSPKGERPKGANPTKKPRPKVVAFLWWTRSDSNRRPPQCECGALPAALLAHSSAYWRNIFIIAQLPPLCNAKNCTNLAVICPDCISRTALRAFADSPLRSLPSPSPGIAPLAVSSTPSEGCG